MPWRLVILIVIGAVFLSFIGFNLENRCDISLGFYVFPQVPVFLSAMSAFVLGMALALPLAVSFRSAARRKKKPELPPAGGNSGKKKGKATAAADDHAAAPPPDGDYGTD
jgi:hypothetical protein